MPLTKVIPGMIDGSVSGGATNLITDGDAESGTVTNYIEGSYTAATRPAGTFTPSSGAGTFTISNSATAPLFGTRSFILTKSSGASRQGRAIERTITIDSGYQASVMDVFFQYKVDSGTFVAGSSTTDSSMIVYFALSPNGTTWTIREPSSFKLLSNSTTLMDTMIGSVQTDADTTHVKVIMYVAETANSAWSLKCELGVRPTNYTYGTPITDWFAYTPTFAALGTVTGIEMFWRRVGSNAEIAGRFTNGTVTGSNATFTIPAGMSVNLPNSRVLGVYGHQGSATGELLVWGGSNLIQFGGDNWQVPMTGTQLGTSGFTTVSLSVPIVGWSSSVQMSDSTDTRVVSAKMSASTGQSLSTGVSTKISLNTAKFDSHGGVNTTLNRYTIQVAGSYNFTGSINLAVSAAAYELTAILYKNNTPFSYTSIGKSGTSGVPHSVTYSFKDDSAKTGDYYELYAVQDSGGSITARGDATANDLTTMLVERITGPSAIAASETVAAAVTRSTTQSAIANTVFTKIQFNNKRFDTHNAFDSVTNFRFNAPISGIYEFTGAINFAISAAAFELGAGLYINNVKVTQAIVSKGGTASVPSGTAFALMARMVAGDYAEIFVYQESGAALDIRGDASDIGLTHLNIKRIGL